MKRIVLLLAAAAVGSLALSAPVLSQTPSATPGARPTSPATTAPVKTPAAAPAPAKVGEYASEAEAKQRCGTDAVVWINPSSHIYHLAGSKDYGKTKRGAYMCKAQAERAGNRAAKNEKAKT